MEYIRFLVMTKSSKNKGYCVAGFDAYTGRWIRLVSNDIEKHGALSNKHLTFSNGLECTVGNVIGVWVETPVPSLCQTENFLISNTRRIVFLDHYGDDRIHGIHPLEKPSFIFCNERSYLTAEEIIKLNYSLCFVEVFDLQLSLKPSTNGKMKSKVSFTYNGIRYHDISMTDPAYYSFNLTAGCAWMVVSLPNEAYGNDKLFFKFVARIIPISGIHKSIKQE